MKEKIPNYSAYKISELADILRHYKDYNDKEVENVYEELQQRGELQAVIEQLKLEVADGKMDVSSHNNPDASVETFNADDPIVMVLGSDQQLIFEQMIGDEAIPCYRHERLLVFNPETMVYYYFKNEDLKRVNEIQKEAEAFIISAKKEVDSDNFRKSPGSSSNLFIWAILLIALTLAVVFWMRK